MNYKSLLATSIALSSLTLVACNDTTTDSKAPKADTTVATTTSTTTTTTQDAIKLSKVEGSKEFKDAALGIKKVTSELQGTDSVKITVEYDVRNYQLGAQTDATPSTECNNSKQGQHIHFILDQGAYTALYEPKHTFTVAINSEHYVMSFLSRSYHESIKNGAAGKLLHFSVDEKGTYKELKNPTTPMVFYSRPKGDYLGNDTKNVLLDFYVYNTNLSARGNKVKATINGADFMIDDWQSNFIQNAPMGSLKVNLQLVDKDGKNLDGPNNNANREVKLAQQEPIK